jgi:hypothetical protein
MTWRVHKINARSQTHEAHYVHQSAACEATGQILKHDGRLGLGRASRRLWRHVCAVANQSVGRCYLAQRRNAVALLDML